jgi:hypothetical protein
MKPPSGDVPTAASPATSRATTTSTEPGNRRRAYRISPMTARITVAATGTCSPWCLASTDDGHGQRDQRVGQVRRDHGPQALAPGSGQRARVRRN